MINAPLTFALIELGSIYFFSSLPLSLIHESSHAFNCKYGFAFFFFLFFFFIPCLWLFTVMPHVLFKVFVSGGSAWVEYVMAKHFLRSENMISLHFTVFLQFYLNVFCAPYKSQNQMIPIDCAFPQKEADVFLYYGSFVSVKNLTGVSCCCRSVYISMLFLIMWCGRKKNIIKDLCLFCLQKITLISTMNWIFQMIQKMQAHHFVVILVRDIEKQTQTVIDFICSSTLLLDNHKLLWSSWLRNNVRPCIC